MNLSRLPPNKTLTRVEIPTDNRTVNIPQGVTSIVGYFDDHGVTALHAIPVANLDSISLTSYTTFYLTDNADVVANIDHYDFVLAENGDLAITISDNKKMLSALVCTNINRGASYSDALVDVIYNISVDFSRVFNALEAVKDGDDLEFNGDDFEFMSEGYDIGRNVRLREWGLKAECHTFRLRLNIAYVQGLGVGRYSDVHINTHVARADSISHLVLAHYFDVVYETDTNTGLLTDEPVFIEDRVTGAGVADPYRRSERISLQNRSVKALLAWTIANRENLDADMIIPNHHMALFGDSHKLINPIGVNSLNQAILDGDSTRTISSQTE